MGLVSNKAVQDKLLIIFVRWIFLLIHPSWSPSHRQALKEKRKVKLEKMICQCCQHSQESPGSHLQDFTSHFAKKGVISVGKREGQYYHIYHFQSHSNIFWNGVDSFALTHPSQIPVQLLSPVFSLKRHLWLLAKAISLAILLQVMANTASSCPA